MNDKEEYFKKQKKSLLKTNQVKRFWTIDEYGHGFFLPMTRTRGFEPIYNGKLDSLKPNETYTSMWAEFDTNPNMVDDYSISYKMNKDGFRSDNFIKKHGGLHILFAGCSETFGSAANLNDVWAKMCYDKISSYKRVSGYFNIGHPGASMFTILNQILVYIENYGSPDLLLLNVPNFERTYGWSFDHNQIMQETDQGIHSNKKKYFDRIFQNAYLYWTLERMCKIMNIKLIWSCWQQVDAFNIEFLNIFNNYISITNAEDFGKYHMENWDKYKDIPYSLVRRDAQHHGTFIHRYWADKFIEAVNSYEI
jgi:hypothetical protein